MTLGLHRVPCLRADAQRAGTLTLRKRVDVVIHVRYVREGQRVRGAVYEVEAEGGEAFTGGFECDCWEGKV